MRFYEKVPFEVKSLRDLDKELESIIDTRFWIYHRFGGDPKLLENCSKKYTEVCEQQKRIIKNTPNESTKRCHRFIVKSKKIVFWGLIKWEVEDYVVSINKERALEKLIKGKMNENL